MAWNWLQIMFDPHDGSVKPLMGDGCETAVGAHLQVLKILQDGGLAYAAALWMTVSLDEPEMALYPFAWCLYEYTEEEGRLEGGRRVYREKVHATMALAEAVSRMGGGGV